MFDISWSELLILGIVTLVFVGPKELPVFLRTLGRYAGIVRRQANEFKAQFDAAMREAELDSMRKEVEQMQNSVNSEVMRAKASINGAAGASQFDAPSTTVAPSGQLSPVPSPVLNPPLPTPASEMATAAQPSAIAKTES
jgi:sec-independent protein translocase protein TatB